MQDDKPKLRKDLIFQKQGTGEEIHYVVKDPVFNRFYRLEEVECDIARLFDGKSNLSEVRVEFEKTYDATLSLETLEDFVRQISELGLFEGELTKEQIKQLRRKTLAEEFEKSGLIGRLIFIKLKAIDPDNFFNKVIPHIQFFFGSTFIILSVLLIIFAIGISIANWDLFGEAIKRLFSLQSIILLWITMFFVITLHEFAHGLTCKHFGGEVHEIGFLLLYFQPCFYCNVSDAWLFTEKRRKLWVTFAGAFFETLIWAIAVIFWRVTAPETFINRICFIIVFLTGMGIILNFNPLIKLDGYYLLSDYLDIPNLRQRAFGHISSRIRRFFFGRDAEVEEVSSREKKIYLIYGISAVFYSVFLLGYIFAMFAGFLIEEYHGTGLLIFLLIIFLLFNKILKNILVGTLKFIKLRLVMLMRIKTLAIGIPIVALAAAVLALGRAELKISSDFTLLPLNKVTVRPEVAGTIEEIHFDEGDTVQAGALIARLANESYVAEIKKMEAEINFQKVNLKLLRRGPRKEEITLVKKKVDRLRTEVQFAQKNLNRATTLFNKGLIADEKYEDAQKDLAIKGKELEEANSELKAIQAGISQDLVVYRPEEIEKVEAKLNSLAAELKYLQMQNDRTRITSPISGIIATPKLKQRIKKHLEVGDELCQIVNYRTVIAEMPVPEKEISEIKSGQQVQLKARGYPARTFYGKVTSISPVAQANGNQQVVTVRSEIENLTLLLKPEMTGNAKIYCGKRRILDLLTRRIVRFIRVEFWGWGDFLVPDNRNKNEIHRDSETQTTQDLIASPSNSSISTLSSTPSVEREIGKDESGNIDSRQSEPSQNTLDKLKLESTTPIDQLETSKITPQSLASAANYTIFSGSYAKQTDAEVRVRKLLEKGFTATVEKTQLDNNTIVYRVKIGEYQDFKSASAIKDKLTSQGESAWIKKN